MTSTGFPSIDCAVCGAGQVIAKGGEGGVGDVGVPPHAAPSPDAATSHGSQRALLKDEPDPAPETSGIAGRGVLLGRAEHDR